jgi:hypothetical protein
MKRPNHIFPLNNWVHDPKRRKSRFRCVSCSKIVQDHSDLIMERGAGVWHAGCWASTVNDPKSLAYAALCRAGDIENKKWIEKNTRIYSGK